MCLSQVYSTMTALTEYRTQDPWVQDPDAYHLITHQWHFMFRQEESQTFQIAMTPEVMVVTSDKL